MDICYPTVEILDSSACHHMQDDMKETQKGSSGEKDEVVLFYSWENKIR